MQAQKTTMVRNLKANRVLAEGHDKVIAQRIKTVREQRRLTQKDVANAIGVSFQQFQKYENGVNRVSGGSLQLIARTLGVQVDYFFAGHQAPKTAYGLAESEQQEPFQGAEAETEQPETVAGPNPFIDQLLAMAYSAADPALQGDILALVKTLVDRKK